MTGEMLVIIAIIGVEIEEMTVVAVVETEETTVEAAEMIAEAAVVVQEDNLVSGCQ